jgi:hypothetical protein
MACTLGVCLQLSGGFVTQAQSAKQPAESSVATKIAGTVVSSMTGTPLGQTRVSISETKNRDDMRWMITSDNGRFEFDQVPAGKYALQGGKRGFLSGAYEQHEQFSTAIVTGTEFDTANLVLRLTPMAMIDGKVVDESGDPVREARVMLYIENRRGGVTRISPAGGGNTNDLGAFEFASLAPGKYYISVSAKPWFAMHPFSAAAEGAGKSIQGIDRTLDVAYPTTYYGGATDADNAVPIEVKGGDRLQIDVHLNPVPSLHLVFRVPEGSEQHGISAPLLEKRVFDSKEFVQSDGVQQVSEGVYELGGVPAGTYSVRLQEPGSQQPAQMSELELRTDGQELDTTRGELEGSVKLSIQMPHQEPIPKQLAVALRDKDRRIVAFQQVDAGGEATMQNLAAGKYAILIYSPGKPYSVLRTSSEAGQTAGHELNLPVGGALALTVSLAGGAVTIEGFAKRGGKSAPGVMVVLIPKDARGQEELFRRDQSNSDGSFVLRGVIPGTYALVAIEDAWGFDWSKPVQLARYAEHGQAVKIPAEAHDMIHLPEPIEVQPR